MGGTYASSCGYYSRMNYGSDEPMSAWAFNNTCEIKEINNICKAKQLLNNCKHPKDQGQLVLILLCFLFTYFLNGTTMDIIFTRDGSLPSVGCPVGLDDQKPRCSRPKVTTVFAWSVLFELHWNPSVNLTAKRHIFRNAHRISLYFTGDKGKRNTVIVLLFLMSFIGRQKFHSRGYRTFCGEGEEYRQSF